MIKEDNLFDANSVAITNDVSEIDEVLDFEEILLSISNSIITYRKSNKMTQDKLAKKLDMDQTMVSKIERGTYNPTIKLLYSISRKLTKSADLFIEILKDIIKNLSKNKNYLYNQQFQMCENHNAHRDNIVYLDTRRNLNNKNYGGTIYGKINNSCRVSAN